MDKLTMAQRFAEIFASKIERPDLIQSDDTMKIIALNANKLADAMQAEADKRNHNIVDPNEKVEDKSGSCLHFWTTFGGKDCFDCGISLEEWQPDWSQAPKWANWWVMHSDNGLCYWTASKPVKKWNKFLVGKNEGASTFNYQGDWRKSLRKRPE